MGYSSVVGFSGDSERAFARFEQALIPNGFVIASQDHSCIEFRGPRLLNSSRENPLRGASQLRVSPEREELRLDASFDGIVVLTAVIALVAVVFPLSVSEGILDPEQPIDEMGRIGLIWTPLVMAFYWWMRLRTVSALRKLLEHVARSER